MIEEGNMDVGDNRIWLAMLCLSQTAEDDVMIRPIGSQGNRLWLTSHDFHQAVSCLYSAHSELRRGHYEALRLVLQSTNESGL